MYGVLCLYLVLGLFSIYSTIMSDQQLNSITKCKCVIVRNNSPSNCFGCLTMDVIYSFMFRFARRTLWSLQMGHYKKRFINLLSYISMEYLWVFLLICKKKKRKHFVSFAWIHLNISFYLHFIVNRIYLNSNNMPSRTICMCTGRIRSDNI